MPKRTTFAILRAEDYATAQRILPDMQLPEFFEEWIEAAEKRIAEMEARGIIVQKVPIDLNQFMAWCHAGGLDHNFATFGAFTVAAARKQDEEGT